MVDGRVDRRWLTNQEVLTEISQLQSSRQYRDHQNLFYIEGVRNFLQEKEVLNRPYKSILFVYFTKLSRIVTTHP